MQARTMEEYAVVETNVLAAILLLAAFLPLQDIDRMAELLHMEDLEPVMHLDPAKRPIQRSRGVERPDTAVVLPP